MAEMFTCKSAHHVITQWKCVLRCCNKCPNMFITSQEANRDTTNMFPTIRFVSTEMYHAVKFMSDIHMKNKKNVQYVPQSLALILLIKYTHGRGLCYQTH